MCGSGARPSPSCAHHFLERETEAHKGSLLPGWNRKPGIPSSHIPLPSTPCFLSTPTLPAGCPSSGHRAPPEASPLGRAGCVSGSGRDPSRTPRPSPLPPQRAGLAAGTWQPALCPAPRHTPRRHSSPSLPLPGEEWVGPVRHKAEDGPGVGKRGLTTCEKFGDHGPPDSILSLLAFTRPCDGLFRALCGDQSVVYDFGQVTSSEAQFPHL